MKKHQTLNETSILDNLRTGILLLNNKYQVVYCNIAAERIFGRSSIQNRPLADILPANEIRKQLEAVSDGSHSVLLREVTVLNTLAKPVTLNIDISSYGKNYLLELEKIDLLIERFQHDVKLQQQDASFSLLRGLAHEIKNPLGGIRGAAQLLAAEHNTTDISEYTDIIVSESDRLQSLIDRMLKPNNQPIQKLVNIHEITEHVYSLMRSDTEKNVTIERNYDASIPEVLIDRDQLIQVLINLVKNAYEAVGDEGLINITTRIERQKTINHTMHTSTLNIAVSDDGPGIKDDFFPNIFLPMISDKANGSGLGLPIAQKLVSLNGGELNCTSHYNGCVFEISLPLPLK